MRDYFLKIGIANILVRCVGNFEEGQNVELLDHQYSELTLIFKEDLKMSDDQINAITGKTFSAPPIPSRCWIVAFQYTAGIDSDGEVYLCSPWSQKEHSIGNVNKKRFCSLWGSEKHKEIAETLNHKMRIGRCNPLLCRHYYSNLAIDGFIGGFIEPLPKSKIEDDYGRFI